MTAKSVSEFEDECARVSSTVELAIAEALEICKPLVLDGIADNFARQQSPDGAAWPERKEIGDGHPLLVETQTEGAGSLYSAASGQGAGHVSRTEGDSLVVGVDKAGGIGGIPGAGVHNYGFPEKNIPQREFMGVSEEVLLECEEVIAKQVLEKLIQG